MNQTTNISSSVAIGNGDIFPPSKFDYVIRVTVNIQHCALTNPVAFEAPMQATIIGKAVENKIHLIHDFGGIESGESFDVIDSIVVREHQDPYTRVTFMPNGEDRPTGRVEIGLTVDEFSTLARYVTLPPAEHDEIRHPSHHRVMEVTGVAYGPLNITETFTTDVIQVTWEGRLLPNEAEEIGIDVKPSHFPPPQHNEPAKDFKKRSNPGPSLSDALRSRLTDNHEAGPCPQCGSAMIPQNNRVTGSPFYGCTKYPGCRGTRPIQTDQAVGPKCPHCGRTMVRRTAKWGQHAGQPFWGCSKFPDCRGTRE